MRNIDVVNKIIADKYKRDEKTIKSINSLYWKMFRSKLVNAEVQALVAKGLGTFHVSHYNLYKSIKNTIKKIRFLRTTDKLPEKSKQIRLELHLGRLRTFLKRRNEIAQQNYDRRISQINTERDKEL